MELHWLPVGQVSLPVSLIPSPRRQTTVLRITRERRVEVLVPAGTSFADVLPFLTQKTPWLQRKLTHLASLPQPPSRRYDSGESLPYLGRDYRLEVVAGSGRGTCSFPDGEVLLVTVPGSPDRVRQAGRVRRTLEAWYRGRAAILLEERTRAYAPLLGVQPRRVAIKQQKTRWGSCSATNGQLNLNWVLIMAPLAILDYVVVHELAHLLVPEHSPRFWLTVEKILPDYRTRRRWLKENGHLLKL